MDAVAWVRGRACENQSTETRVPTYAFIKTKYDPQEFQLFLTTAKDSFHVGKLHGN